MEKKHDLMWEFNDELKKTLIERVIELVQDMVQNFVYEPINWIYYDRVKSQKKKIRIDYWDTWNMDYTLSFIILPMLKQLKERRVASTVTTGEDVCEELKPSKEEEERFKFYGEVDEKNEARWDYILGEMIFAFESIVLDEDDEYSGEEYKSRQVRINNGLRLFGKYYRSLWD